MKKVVFLHQDYHEQAMGGAEYQIYLLIQYLQKQEPQTQIYYIFENNSKKVKNDLNVFLIPLRKILPRKTFGDYFFLYRKQINKHLKLIKPDVIYTRCFSSWSGIAAEYALKSNIIHIWAIAHDNDLLRLGKKVLLRKFLDKIENKIVLYAFKNATYIITQNKFQQNLLLEKYERDGYLITQSAQLCDETSIKKSNKEIIVLWIGNLKPIKRPELFLQIVTELKDIENVKFIMIGKPDFQYNLLLSKTQSEIKNFTYLGLRTNYEVNTQLLKSHILVNTSDSEGFSNTFVQAWMRKVVVCSLNSNPDEILTNEKIGFVDSNITVISSILRELIKETDKRIFIAEKSYLYAIKNHCVFNNFKKVMALMNITK